MHGAAAEMHGERRRKGNAGAALPSRDAGRRRCEGSNSKKKTSINNVMFAMRVTHLSEIWPSRIDCDSETVRSRVGGHAGPLPPAAGAGSGNITNESFALEIMNYFNFGEKT